MVCPFVSPIRSTFVDHLDYRPGFEETPEAVAGRMIGRIQQVANGYADHFRRPVLWKIVSILGDPTPAHFTRFTLKVEFHAG